MAKSFTYKQFLETYPNDDACLAHLCETRYGKEPVCPKCGQIGTFHKLKKLPAYTCNCGHHIHPMAVTPFYRSRTSLRTWFYVMFLFCATRNGVSAKEIQRLTGVTYKTAWRIGHEVRKYMGWVDGGRKLGGSGGGFPIVEVDKAFIGGRDKMGEDDKAIVLGMTERKGEVLTRVIPTRRLEDVIPVIKEWIEPGSRVATDKAKAFDQRQQISDGARLRGAYGFKAPPRFAGGAFSLPFALVAFFGSAFGFPKGFPVAIARKRRLKRLESPTKTDVSGCLTIFGSTRIRFDEFV